VNEKRYRLVKMRNAASLAARFFSLDQKKARACHLAIDLFYSLIGVVFDIYFSDAIQFVE